jgi:hypothetical protein
MAISAYFCAVTSASKTLARIFSHPRLRQALIRLNPPAIWYPFLCWISQGGDISPTVSIERLSASIDVSVVIPKVMSEESISSSTTVLSLYNITGKSIRKTPPVGKKHYRGV